VKRKENEIEVQPKSKKKKRKRRKSMNRTIEEENHQVKLENDEEAKVSPEQ
jgi:hypothetical protein